MTTLGNERGAGATTQHLRYERELWDLVDDARKRGRSDDPLVRQDLAWAYTHVELMRYQGLRLLSALAAKREPGPEASVNKLFWSEYQQRVGEIAMGIIGADGMVGPGGRPDRTVGEPDPGYRLGRWQTTFVSGRAVTIFSGTSEIQRNIIGERALGLPREPE
jgi:alkylation response protein AidB-like acyl-CoA dehydrogenase